MMSEPVALFVTCLVDQVKPKIGFDVVRVLAAAGFEVEVPGTQTCCGQPNYNGGDRAGAMAVARRTVDLLAGFRHVVVPSGSCAGMIKHHYPQLLADDAVYASRSIELAARVYELATFLTEVAGFTPDAGLPRTVTYHDACAGLRELGVKQAPRQLLVSAGTSIEESSQAETCCGFGGTFCIKYPDISNAMVSSKVEDLVASGAGTVVAGDLGCLLNIEGKLAREGVAIEARHFVELLAENLSAPER